jgi:VWFA-related protein
LKRALAGVIALLLAQSGLPQQPATFRSSVNVVVLNVTALGRDGKPIQTLTKDDFIILEDGKPQQLKSCELQRLERTALPPLDAAALLVRPSTPPPAATPIEDKDTASRFQDRRLIVMLFDFSSMQPAEQIRSVDAAKKFVATQLTASDLVSVMVFSTELKTLLDFTPDRELLLSTIKGFHIGEGSDLAGTPDTGADSEDQSGQFVADETEFNIFNTDRKLAALEDAARKLALHPEKKALVYFSGGVEKTGVDNQSQLRATVNTAVRSNVAFYPIDARGLTASAPGGDATQAGAVGSSLYSGRGQRSLRDSFHNQQETLYTLAAETGGKALLDSNDLTVGLRQIQTDIDSYYILTYASANTAEDGKYRRVQIKLAPRVADLKAKLDYRQGYFAPATFGRMTGADKELQLQQSLESDNPVTSLPLAVEVDYFRLSKAKYFIPVSVKIPGSALSFKNKGSKAATEMDFVGQVRDSRDRLVAAVRDTIPIKVDQTTAEQVGRKQIQYDTGFTLGPGAYKLRFAVRENGEGKAGTYERAFTVPDLGSGAALRLSSVILSNQREPLKQQIAGAQNKKSLLAENALIDTSGYKLVPNVTRVFRPAQTLFVFFEVYDPVIPDTLPQNMRTASISASVALYQDNQKVMESAPVRAGKLSQRGAGILPVWLQVPLKQLKPGQYTCQVNVIDEFGRKFAFPRMSLAILPAVSAAIAVISPDPETRTRQ